MCVCASVSWQLSTDVVSCKCVWTSSSVLLWFLVHTVYPVSSFSVEPFVNSRNSTSSILSEQLLMMKVSSPFSITHLDQSLTKNQKLMQKSMQNSMRQNRCLLCGCGYVCVKGGVSETIVWAHSWCGCLTNLCYPQVCSTSHSLLWWCSTLTGPALVKMWH